MKRTEKTKGMIGYRPTVLESMKISYIREVFGLNSSAVLRELLIGHWTLDELHALARKTSPNHYGTILPYLKKVYAPNKSINYIVRAGEGLYAKEMLGINEPEEREFISDAKNN